MKTTFGKRGVQSDRPVLVKPAELAAEQAAWMGDGTTDHRHNAQSRW